MMTEYNMLAGKSYEGTEQQTMAAIRAILTEEVAVTPEPRQSRAAILPELRAADEPAPARAARSKAAPGLFKRLRGALSFRPGMRHLAIALVALLIAFRPYWVLIGVLLMFALVIGVFQIFGADRIWGRVSRRLHQVERADPARGAALRKRLDRLACTWDRCLDLLPERLADGLYMPDFQDYSEERAEARAQMVSDRLTRMVQNG